MRRCMVILLYVCYGIICRSLLIRHNFLTSIKDFLRSLDSLEIFLSLHHHPCSEAYHCLVKAAAWVEALHSRSLVDHRCELRKHIQHTWKVFVVEQFDEQLFNRNLAMVGLEKIRRTPKRTWSFCVSLYALDIIMCTHLSPLHLNEQSWRGGLMPLDSP